MAQTARSASRSVLSRVLIGAFVGAVVILVVVLVSVARSTTSSTSKQSIRSKAVPQKEYGQDDAQPVIDIEEGFSLLHVDGKLMQSLQTVYVIPGGGSSQGAYPEWTKRRVKEAFNHYQRYRAYSSGAVFLALSAGSLNSANARGIDNRIVFESQHTIRHLVQLGVPTDLIFGDTFSWDTVTNGMTLRMFVEGVQEFRRANEANYVADTTVVGTAPTTTVAGGTPKPTILKPLILEVFISDFHADRVRAAFDWVLNLSPAVAAIELRINTVNSMGIDFGSQLDYMHRIEHEAEGVRQIAENAKKIHTLAQFYAFLMLGGHQGLSKYLHYDYQKSQGAGW